MLALARVSSDRQQEQGTSLEAQTDRFQRWCRARDYPDPIVYVEAESAGEGKRDQRDEYNRLLRDARPGDLILATVVDRWTRDVVDGVATVRDLLKRGCGWVAIDEDIDARTEHGYDSLLDQAAGAEKERRRIRRRTVGARQRLREQGLHVEGLAPLGYRVEKRRLVVDPKTAPTIRRAFAMAAAGSGLRAIVAELGGHVPNWQKRFRDRRYLGETNTRGSKKQQPVGDWIPGTHEALVDRATFDAVQAGLVERRLGGRRPGEAALSAGFLLRGLARCAGCGYVMRSQTSGRRKDEGLGDRVRVTTEAQPARRGSAPLLHSSAAPVDAPGLPGTARAAELASSRRRPQARQPSVLHAGWYACTRCGGPYARQDEVDAEAEQKVLEHLERERVRLRAPAPPPKPQPDTAARRKRLAGQIDRLVAALADGTLRPEEARPRLEKARADLAALDAAAAPPPPAQSREEALATVEGIRRGWAGLTVAERREVVQLLAERVEIAKAGEKWERGAWKLRIRWRRVA